MDDKQYIDLLERQAQLAKILLQFWSASIVGMTAQAAIATHLVERTDDQAFSKKVLAQITESSDSIISLHQSLKNVIEQIDADLKSVGSHAKY